MSDLNPRPDKSSSSKMFKWKVSGLGGGGSGGKKAKGQQQQEKLNNAVDNEASKQQQPNNGNEITGKVSSSKEAKAK